MVNVDIDKELYEEIKQLIKKNKYDYSSVKFFVHKSIYNEILKSSNHLNDFESLYSQLKDLLKDNPSLKSRVEKIYSSETKKLERGIKND